LSNLIVKLNQTILREGLAFRKSPFVLDCGAGNCWMLNNAQGAGFLVGVDLHSHKHNSDSSFTKFIRKDNSAFVYADATKLPFRDQSFDFVVSNEFVSHVYDLDRTLSEQVRVMKLGAVLIVSDAHFLNPAVFLNCFWRNWISSRVSSVKRGGMRWLVHRGVPFRETVLREGHYCDVFWVDENVHSIRWWKKKIGSFEELRYISAVTFWSRMLPSNVTTLGNKVWIEARKSGLNQQTFQR